ncbi:hypothetical protein [Bacillus cereus group sp. TH260-2LC]|uniref:hypothetical protein n=1 Tax=unclassified Bacillus cereus group TaxID=2750818 RepID=UPI0022E2AAFB|nr:hypothetical protein [Bacillus cereus group sp. TH260-2LC]MDA1531115.1 hypothetical protein [Bacillus cereus group sp. TH260-2LC]
MKWTDIKNIIAREIAENSVHNDIEERCKKFGLDISYMTKHQFNDSKEKYVLNVIGAQSDGRYSEEALLEICKTMFCAEFPKVSPKLEKLVYREENIDYFMEVRSLIITFLQEKGYTQKKQLIDEGWVDDLCNIGFISRDEFANDIIKFDNLEIFVKRIIGKYNPEDLKTRFLELISWFSQKVNDKKFDEKITSYNLDFSRRKLGNWIIFASKKWDTDFQIIDFLHNEIEIVKHKDDCLVMEGDFVKSKGLSWKDLFDWWEQKIGGTKEELIVRLYKECQSTPEKLMFKTYLKYTKTNLNLPALLPQVTIKYDPFNKKSRQQKGGEILHRQKADFVMFAPHYKMAIIEIDGKEHYSQKNNQGIYVASPELYAHQVKSDREFMLKNYLIFRFGGHEFTDTNITEHLKSFFESLHKFFITF